MRRHLDPSRFKKAHVAIIRRIVDLSHKERINTRMSMFNLREPEEKVVFRLMMEGGK